MSGGDWTIDELAQRVADALASNGVRAPNGRVTQLPDRRVIRWYATIGLLDRPVRTQGRTARYGERHLLQLVAVKRRQAEGHSLSEIQAELTGATDATLRRVAGHPDPPERSMADNSEPASTRRQFWRTPPAAPVSPATADAAPARRIVTPAAPPAPVYPVPLHAAVTLVLPAQPDEADLAAIHAAARPLLDLLAARGLLTDRPQRSPQ